jgi:hypothetical protein
MGFEIDSQEVKKYPERAGALMEKEDHSDAHEEHGRSEKIHHWSSSGCGTGGPT